MRWILKEHNMYYYSMIAAQIWNGWFPTLRGVSTAKIVNFCSGIIKLRMCKLSFLSSCKIYTYLFVVRPNWLYLAHNIVVIWVLIYSCKNDKATEWISMGITFKFHRLIIITLSYLWKMKLCTYQSFATPTPWGQRGEKGQILGLISLPSVKIVAPPFWGFLLRLSPPLLKAYSLDTNPHTWDKKVCLILSLYLPFVHMGKNFNWCKLQIRAKQVRNCGIEIL